MTAEERKDYNRLTSSQKRYYDLYMGMHPDWGHGQLITMAILCGEGLPEGPKIKDILLENIRKVDQFMEENFPSIYPRVKEFFVRLGNALKTAVQVTWDYIVSLFSKF